VAAWFKDHTPAPGTSRSQDYSDRIEQLQPSAIQVKPAHISAGRKASDPLLRISTLTLPDRAHRPFANTVKLSHRSPPPPGPSKEIGLG